MNMDFFYIEDFIRVLDFYLESIFHSSAPKDLNLVKSNADRLCPFPNTNATVIKKSPQYVAERIMSS